MELLDIKLDQVNEWLVLRRKLDKNWAKYLKPVESKHNLALGKILANKDLERVVNQQVSGYLQCREVLSSLESVVNDKTKTMFGNYSNEFLYEWDSLLRAYEKNNLNLADSAKHLLQLGVYDIPSYKSTESSLEKQLKDLQNKELALSDEIQKKQKHFKEKCKNYGIEGSNIQYELKLKTREIPSIYLKVLELIKSEEFWTIFSAYETVTKSNHNSEVDLKALRKLKAFEFKGNLEDIQGKYCKLIRGEEEAGEEDFDWKIETVQDQGIKEIGTVQSDIPLETKEMRTELINELVELEAFANGYDITCGVIKRIQGHLVDVRELVLIHEQPNYLDRLVQEFSRILNHNLAEKLQECQKMQNGVKQNLRENREKINELLKFAGKLIGFLETGINKLFPNVSIKIVGEVVKDIRNLLGS